MSLIDLTGYDETTNYDTVKLKPPKNVNLQILKYKQEINDFNFEQQNLEYKKITEINIEKLKCTWREVYKIDFGCKFDITPGDSIGLLCPNSDENTQKLLNIFNINKNTAIIYEKKGHDPFYYKGTINDFFKYFFDIKIIPKKNFLYFLAQNCSKKNELLYLCTKEGSADYFKLHSKWITLLEIIEYFGCRPDLEQFLQHASNNKPRHYSFTNKVGENASILVGILEKENKMGHCSEFISKYEKAFFYVTTKPNKLIKPLQTAKMLLIATGLGIAPFLSFVKSLQNDFWLIYGCRNIEDDLSEGIDVRKDVCYSSENQRITNFIENNNQKIYDYVQNDCYVYICGSMHVQNDVNKMLKLHFPFLYEQNRVFCDNWL